MNISEEGLALIRRFEGFSPTIYICPGGYPTIGYGHKILENECFSENGISREDAEMLLKQDVGGFASAIAWLITQNASQGQFDAMVSLAYNIGETAFKKSTLLLYFNNKKPEMAENEFSRWIYSNGRKLPGLIARRAAETQLYRAKS